MKRTSPKLPAFSGRCCAGQFCEAAKQAAETALDEAKARALQEAEKSSRSADSIPVLLAVLFALYSLLTS